MVQNPNQDSGMQREGEEGRRSLRPREFRHARMRFAQRVPCMQLPMIGGWKPVATDDHEYILK